MDDLKPITAPSKEQSDKELAMRDLGDILALKSSKAFNRYFLRRLNERRAELDRALLDDDLSDEEMKFKKRERKTLNSVIKMIEEDEIGNRSISGFVEQNPPPAAQ